MLLREFEGRLSTVHFTVSIFIFYNSNNHLALVCYLIVVFKVSSLISNTIFISISQVYYTISGQQLAVTNCMNCTTLNLHNYTHLFNYALYHKDTYNAYYIRAQSTVEQYAICKQFAFISASIRQYRFITYSINTVV